MFEGHAFIVEAAVSLGGRDVKPGINVFRFANRIPLLFEGGSDVITKTALKRITWPSYKISQNSDKVGLGEWGLLCMAWPACPSGKHATCTLCTAFPLRCTQLYFSSHTLEPESHLGLCQRKLLTCALCTCGRHFFRRCAQARTLHRAPYMP